MRPFSIATAITAREKHRSTQRMPLTVDRKGKTPASTAGPRLLQIGG